MNNQTINEINKRDFDKVFFSLSFISQDIFFNYGDDYIKKRTVYTIIGTTINGTRRYITSIFSDEFSKTSDWYNLLLSFKKRGLEYIFFASIPNDNNIKNAFNLAFKETIFFYSCFNVISKINHYISCSYSRNIFRTLKKLYHSLDINEFNIKKQELLDKYSDSPFIVDILAKELDLFYSFLNYPFIIRKHVISFNFFEGLSYALSFTAHSKNYFFNISEYEELLVPKIQTFELKMYCGKNEWNSVISCLYIDFKELLLCVL